MATKARSSTGDAGPVSWRDGIHLSGTSIWCDARRAQDICFVSAASAVRTARHGQLIASAATLELLQRPGGLPFADGQLGVPYGQPFTLGVQRIELFRSGHAMGSAALLVETEHGRVVYAGAINPTGSKLGGAIDHRSCDVLVVAAPYGDPRFAFPDPDEVVGELAALCREGSQGGKATMLLVADLGKALDLWLRVAEHGLDLHAHRSFYDIMARLSKAHTELPPIRRWEGAARSGVVLWPLHLHDKIDRQRMPAASEIVLVSGRATDSEMVSAVGASVGMVLSNQADHRALVDFIRTSGAKEVYLTHAADRGAGLRAALPDRRIECIGPPKQLELF